MPSGSLVSFESLLLNNQNINSHPQLADRLINYLGAISNDGYVPASEILNAIYELAPTNEDAEEILSELINQLQAEGIVLSILSDGGGESATLSVDENTTSVTTVFALDPDGDAVNYSIVGGADATLFEIDSLTGQLTFKDPQDFEAFSDADGNGTFEVVVQASDSNSNQIDRQSIFVVLANVNEAPNLLSVSETLTEDSAPVLIDLASLATDPDADDTTDTFEFVLTSSPALGSAVIDNGILTFDPGLDFQYLGSSETQLVEVQVQVSDSEGASNHAVFSFEVIGNNDAPTVEAPLNLEVVEGQVVSQIDLLGGAMDVDATDTLTIDNLILSAGNASGIVIEQNILSIDPSAYDYLLQGQTETIEYTYQINDGNGGTVEQTATISVAGEGPLEPLVVTEFDRLLSWDTTGFDANRVYHPTVYVNDDSSIDLFYAGLGNANILDMGYARSVDGFSFSRVVETPVIDASEDNPSWASWLARPVSVFKLDGEFVIYFGGDNSNLQTDPQNQEGWTRATSLDGINWTIPDAPIRVDVGPGQGARLVEVVQTQDSYIAYWLDLNPDGNHVSMMATSSDGISFQNDQSVDYGDHYLETATFHDGEVLGVFRPKTDNNGTNTLLLGRSSDGINFEFGETITTSKQVSVNELVVRDDGVVDFFAGYNEGNINWNFGNLVIERFEVGLNYFEVMEPQVQTLTISETFDDGILNLDGWSYLFDNNVSEENGTLNLEILATDVRSRATIDFGESLTSMSMNYDVRMHAANDHFYGEHNWNFVSENGDDFVVRFRPQSTTHGPSYDNDPAKFDQPMILLVDPTGSNVKSFSVGNATSSFFDDWTEIQFEFNGDTGTVTVDMESDGVVDMEITADILFGATAESYTFGTYGWFTGHKSEFDNLEITGDYFNLEDGF